MAFDKLNNKFPKAKLILTIEAKYKNLLKLIGSYVDNGRNIQNLGMVDQNTLTEVMSRADICIYPSLKESFGLGLIEATQFEMPIMAANLPYVHDVVDNILLFDPTDFEDIYIKMSEGMSAEKVKPILKVSNQVKLLRDLLFV